MENHPAQILQKHAEDFAGPLDVSVIEQLEKSFYGPIIRLLTDYIGELEAQLASFAWPFDEVTDAINRYLNNLASIDTAYEKALQDELLLAELESLGVGISSAADALSLGIDYSIQHPEAQAYARAESAKLAKGITATTKQSIGNAIASGIRSGASRNDISLSIKEIKSDLPDWRAKLIAQTEVIRAYTGGQLLYYKEAGVRKKEWIDGQPDACPTCTGHNKTVKDLDEDWTSVFGTYSGPPAHPGCRCTIGAVFDDFAPLNRSEIEDDWVKAWNSGPGADGIVKSGYLDKYADKAPKGLSVWHTGDQDSDYLYVSNTRGGAESAGRGKLYKYEVEENALIYPDPETLLGGNVYTGLGSLKKNDAAIIRKSALNSVKY